MTGSYWALSLCSKFHYNGNNLKEFIAVTCEPRKSHVTWWILETCLTVPDPEISMSAIATNINMLQLIMFLFWKGHKVKQYCFSLTQEGIAAGTCTFLHRIMKMSVKLENNILIRNWLHNVQVLKTQTILLHHLTIFPSFHHLNLQN